MRLFGREFPKFCMRDFFLCVKPQLMRVPGRDGQDVTIRF